MKEFVCLLVCVFAATRGADAASRTVCASGCQYTNVQTAINEAAPGDIILLRAGETFTGNVVLKAKSSTSTAFITIRSDAAASSLPADGVRLVPEGRPGANTSRSALARLIGYGGSWKSTPVVRAEPRAHHYRLQFLDIDGTANLGYETLVAIGENTANQATVDAAPHSIVLDRVYLHGHASKGMKRGIALNSRSTDVINSYIASLMSTSDSQAIGGANGVGPFKILNNYLEATGENIMFGGADPRTPGLVPSDILIRGNHFFKQPAWRNAVLATPPAPSVSARSGGSLAAGTQYFTVVAVMSTNGDPVVSAPSPEAAVAVGAGGAALLSWSAVAGADYYRVYRGTQSRAQNVYVETTSSSPTLLYTGAGQKSGSPSASGTRWTTKNHLELKNAQRVTIDGNLFEHNWGGFQHGYAILFTPKNQERTAPWTVVKDVTFTNNVVRHVANGISISGYDYESATQQGRNFTIANNLFIDISTAYDGDRGAFLLIANGPANVIVDHNTVLHDGAVLLEVGGPAVPGFVYSNNLSKHNTYGVKGQSRAVGTDTLNVYFPGWVFRGNVLAGGSAAAYPPGNFFPTVAQFNASFVDAGAGNYALVALSALNNAGTDGRDIGVDTASLPGGSPPDDDPPPNATDLPEGWLSQDVGLVGLPGAATATGGTFSVTGGGADIWGTTDAFHFAYRQMAGDGVMIARVAAVAGDAPWTKVGVMIRAATAPNAAHASMFVSRGKGLAFQRRPQAGGTSLHTYGGPGVAPRWVRIAREGNVVTASVSVDGQSWTVVGSDSISLPTDALIGFAVSSHAQTALATAAFDRVEVVAGGALPSGWESTDIGAVGLAGTASESAGTFSLKGAGADVWGSVDSLQFVWRPLTADGEIVARVAAVDGVQPWTKVGVMIRQTLDAGAAQAFMLVSTGKGLAFQRRTVTGGSSTHTSGGSGVAPRWLKLVRRGGVITASVSTNGSAWTVVGSDTFSIVGAVSVGLAVSSHDAGRLASGIFDSVTVTPQ